MFFFGVFFAFLLMGFIGAGFWGVVFMWLLDYIDAK